jgi:hypothetical protein
MAAPPDAGPIVLDLGDAVWSYGADASGVRQVVSGRTDNAVVTLTIDAAIATTLLSRGLPRAEAEAAIRATGETELATTLRASVAAVSSGYYADL